MEYGMELYNFVRLTMWLPMWHSTPLVAHRNSNCWSTNDEDWLHYFLYCIHSILDGVRTTVLLHCNCNCTLLVHTAYSKKTLPRVRGYDRIALIVQSHKSWHAFSDWFHLCTYNLYDRLKINSVDLINLGLTTFQRSELYLRDKVRVPLSSNFDSNFINGGQ